MKIVTIPAEPEPRETGEFNNGDLYINRKRYARGNRKDIFICATGFLIDVCTGNVQHNIEQAGLNRGDYVNVTTKFTLVFNDILAEKDAKIRQLADELHAMREGD